MILESDFCKFSNDKFCEHHQNLANMDICNKLGGIPVEESMAECGVPKRAPRAYKDTRMADKFERDTVQLELEKEKKTVEHRSVGTAHCPQPRRFIQETLE